MKSKECPISKEILENEYNELGIKNLTKKYNVCKQTIWKWLKYYNINRYGRKYIREDLSNRVFGDLTVIRYCHWKEFNTPKYKTMWLCKCSCGNERLVDSYQLTHGLITSCGCKNGEPLYKGVGDLSGAYYASLRKGAELRNLSFNVSKEFLWDLFNKQNGKCALSGVDIKLEKHFKGSNQTASLDRIDNKRGYEEDNVQWVHKKINLFKRGYDEQTLYDYCKKIYTTMRRKYGKIS